MSIEKIFTLLFCLFLGILPLVFTDSFEAPKFILFTSGSVFFSLIFLFFSILKKISMKLLKVHYVLFMLAIVLFFADVTGVDPVISLIGSGYRFQGFITFLSGVLLFFTISFWSKIFPNFYTYLFSSIIISSSILAGISIYQFLNIHFLNNLAVPRFDERVVGTLGNPNFLGGYLAVAFSFMYLQNTKFSSIKLNLHPKIKNILLGIFIIAIIASFSRSAIFAILIIAIMPIVIIKIKNRAVLFGTSLVIVLAIVSIGSLRNSIYDTRQLIWSHGFQAVVNSPVFGYGQENFEIIFPLDRYMKVDSAHNIFLEFAVAGGVIAIFLFIWFLVLIFKLARFDMRFMMIAFLITAFFNPISIAQWSLFWIISGVSASKE